MRTTIELSDPIYRRLKEVALERGVRGFSPIVEDALVGYLAADHRKRELVGAIEAAAGTWSDEDVAEIERAREEAWSSWHVDPS